MTVSAWWFVGRVCWKSRARDFGHVPEGKEGSTLGSHLLPSLLRLPIPSVHRMQSNMHSVKHRCEAQMNAYRNARNCGRLTTAVGCCGGRREVG